MRTVLRFLLGDREAIVRVAGDRRALATGALLVATAAIARNYDQVFVPGHLERLAVPYIVSLLSSLLIFAFVTFRIRLLDRGALSPQYVAFLRIFWMTAPLAWLYAVPVEAICDPLPAAKWNVAFLAVVSFWRVALVIRAVRVLSEASWVLIAAAVLFPAALEAFTASLFGSLSLVGIMGGLQLSEHHAFLVTANNVAVQGALVVGAISFVVLVLPWGRLPRAAHPLDRPAPGAPSMRPVVAATLLLLAVAATVPLQSKLRHQHTIERLLIAADYAGAVAFASARAPEDFLRSRPFPPDPHSQQAGYLTVLIRELDGSEPAWLREIWLQGFGVALDRGVSTGRGDAAKELLEHLESLPGAEGVAEKYRESLDRRPEWAR